MNCDELIVITVESILVTYRLVSLDMATVYEKYPSTIVHKIKNISL